MWKKYRLKYAVLEPKLLVDNVFDKFFKKISLFS